MTKDKTKKLILEQLSKTPIIEAVCKKVGIARSSFYRWRKDDKDFAQAVDEALTKGKSLINDMAESQLISAIKDKNMTAIIFWLKNNHRNYKNKVEVSGELKTNQELSPEQKLLIKKALELALPEGNDNQEPQTYGKEQNK